MEIAKFFLLMACPPVDGYPLGFRWNNCSGEIQQSRFPLRYFVKVLGGSDGNYYETKKT